MNKNNLLKIQEFGQSIWLDYISRGMIHSGELKRLIEEDGLRGVTSNPSIFDQAFEGSQDYEEPIRALSQEGKTAEEIYQVLTVEDVQLAADEFRHLYDTSEGAHGFVSLEVNPHLAYRTEETMAEARELWRSLARPNVFIKVPATKEGLPAIQQLISEGINVNVTLLFGLPRYREVAAAYIAGLEERAAAGKPLDRVCSVASFFLSRIDVLVDAKLEEIMAGRGSQAETAEKLHGQVAIASAKEAYQIYKEIFGHERFQRLAAKGGRPQRVLWASTSTKNPDYSEVKYVEPLIGPETINTLPQETLKAYRDHGNPQERLEQGLEEARKVLELLPEVDMDIDQLTQQLEKEGVDKFNKPYDRLLETLAKKRSQVLEKKPQAQKTAPG
jgi:transaldolase